MSERRLVIFAGILAMGVIGLVFCLLSAIRDVRHWQNMALQVIVEKCQHDARMAEALRTRTQMAEELLVRLRAQSSQSNQSNQNNQINSTDYARPRN